MPTRPRRDRVPGRRSRLRGIDGAVSDPIANTLYQSEGYGDFTYEISLTNGTYDVVLHFAETHWTDDGVHVFDVSIEGSEVNGGSLTLDFSTISDNATVSAIEIVDAVDTPAPSNPVRESTTAVDIA